MIFGNWEHWVDQPGHAACVVQREDLTFSKMYPQSLAGPKKSERFLNLGHVRLQVGCKNQDFVYKAVCNSWFPTWTLWRFGWRSKCRERGSSARLNSKGDRGHPCSVPLWSRILEMRPAVTTFVDGKEYMAETRCRNGAEKQNFMSTILNQWKLTLSKVFSASNGVVIGRVGSRRLQHHKDFPYFWGGRSPLGETHLRRVDKQGHDLRQPVGHYFRQEVWVQQWYRVVGARLQVALSFLRDYFNMGLIP